METIQYGDHSFISQTHKRVFIFMCSNYQIFACYERNTKNNFKREKKKHLQTAFAVEYIFQ